MCSDAVELAENQFPRNGDVRHADRDSAAITVNKLSKIYYQYNKPFDRLKQMVFGSRRKYYEEFTALNDVSFDLPKGEVLGVVGRNGAGKSTLLQLICGTLTPSSGSVLVNGRIAALLELGAGFNPLFTGRENVYLSAAVMGLSRDQVDVKLEEIIEFSGIRPFIDRPVSTYSSGMYVRLAFSVATSVEPDVLVIDEALSVGDGDFARRSFERIMSMREAGVSILFCSHSLYQVEVLCTRAIWLEAGKVQASGTPSEVVPAYQSFLDRMAGDGRSGKPSSLKRKDEEAGEEPIAEPVADLPAQQGRGARITQVQWQTASASGKGGVANCQLKSGDSLQIDVEFQVSPSILEQGTPQVAAAIHSAGGQLVTSCGSWAEGVSPSIDDEGLGHIRLVYDSLPLLKGDYHVGVLLFCSQGIFLYDEADPAVTLQVTQAGQERGLVYLQHRWQNECEHEPKQEGRWRVVDASEVSQSSLLALFEAVFGHAMPASIWRWKYRYAHSPGSVVLDSNGQPIAFNGAIPRPGLMFGAPVSLVQMGDVMSLPQARGTLARKNPFFMAVEHYLLHNVGSDKQHTIAFGFPNARACQVGVKRGLYCEVDKVLELGWPAAQDTSPQSCIEVTAGQFARYQPEIERLWLEMSADLEGVVVGCRNGCWIRHRYLDKPGANYQVYLVSEKPYAGLIVLRSMLSASGDVADMELLDVLGPQSAIPELVKAAQHVAQIHRSTRLFAWATPSAQAWFESTKPDSKPAEVLIPGNALTSALSLRAKGAWWLMGGDTDFR